MPAACSKEVVQYVDQQCFYARGKYVRIPGDELGVYACVWYQKVPHGNEFVCAHELVNVWPIFDEGSPAFCSISGYLF